MPEISYNPVAGRENEQAFTPVMYATMGNATTFPVETLVFWALAHAVRLSSDGIGYTNSLFPEWEDRKAVSVFGDDCIVPTHLAPAYIEACEVVGFEINEAKSFYSSGPGFRESCGGDFLRGENVRPVTIGTPGSERPRSLEAWLYSVLNTVLPKYISFFGQYLALHDRHFFHTWAELFARLHTSFKVVPDDYPDDAGAKVSAHLRVFLSQYRVGPISPLRRDRHGAWSFSFLHWKYKERKDTDDHIRYCLRQRATWLLTQLVECVDPNLEVGLSTTSIEWDNSFARLRIKDRLEPSRPLRIKGLYLEHDPTKRRSSLNRCFWDELEEWYIRGESLPSPG
jgi:hypothetical protein